MLHQEVESDCGIFGEVEVAGGEQVGRGLDVVVKQDLAPPALRSIELPDDYSPVSVDDCVERADDDHVRGGAYLGVDDGHAGRETLGEDLEGAEGGLVEGTEDGDNLPLRLDGEMLPVSRDGYGPDLVGANELRAGLLPGIDRIGRGVTIASVLADATESDLRSDG